MLSALLLLDPPPQKTTPPQSSLKDESPSPSKLKTKRSLMKKKMSVDSNLAAQTNQSRGAPPPPPLERRRTQPEFMSQLAKEMAERRKRGTSGGEAEPVAILEQKDESSKDETTSDEGSMENLNNDSNPHWGEARKDLPVEEVDGGPFMPGSPMRSRGVLKPRGVPAPLPPPQKVALVSQTDGDASPASSTKAPPPVSSKPKRKPKSAGDDEVDYCREGGGEGEREARGISHVKQELEGVESSITAALMDQAGNKLGR